MLVITRKPNDRILFPKLGITIHVVRLDGCKVRLGIDAPRSVHILRHEVLDDGRHDEHTADDPPRLSHAARNQLQRALLGLAVLQRRVELGQAAPSEIDSQIAGVAAQLEQLEAELGAPRGDFEPAECQPRRKTALVVEDDANERTLLADYLQLCNYNVISAGDGQEALDYLASHDRPDVVLLDMTMPRLDGPAMLLKIRQNEALRSVKVVAVSGLSPRQAPVKVGPGGVDRWFTKPIRASELVRELDRELAVA